MGRLFTSGFELQSLTAGMEFEAFNATYLSIDTGTYRSGAASLLSNVTSTGNSYASYTMPTVAAGRTYYGRCYIKVDTLPGIDCSIIGFGLSVGSYGLDVRLETGGTLALYVSGAKVGSSSGAINDGNWHRVEISYTYTGGACTARLNGVEFSTGTLASQAFTVFTVGAAFWSSNTTGKWWFDDLALNDEQGSYQNSFPGDGKVICIRPNGAGESASWLRAGTDSGANWSQCNNIPPNDATSYVRTTTLNALDMYACTDSGIGASDVVNVVAVGGRMCRSAATCPSFKFRIVKTGGGTQSLSAAIVPNSATWRTNANAVPRTSPITLYLDPDSAAWTQTTLDSMQIGVVMTVNQTPYVWISSVWAMVDYTPGVVNKDFSGTATLATSNPNADITRFANLAGAAALATTTPATVDLSRILPFAGTAAMASSTATADLLRYGNLSGVAALQISAPDCDLQALAFKDFAGAAAAVSDTAAPELARYGNFAGAATLISALTTADLLRFANLVGGAALASSIGACDINRFGNLAGVAAISSAAPEADLLRYGNFTGLAELLSLLPDCDLSLLGGSYKEFAGEAALVSATTAPELSRYGNFAGAATLISALTTADLLRFVNLSGGAALASSIGACDINRFGNLAGIAAISSAAPEAGLLRYGNFVGLAGILSLLPDCDLSLLGGSYKEFAGEAILAPLTAAADLGRYSLFGAAAGMVADTPGAGLNRYGNLAGTAVLQGVTPVADLSGIPYIAGELSVVPSCQRLNVLPECQRLNVLPECQRLNVVPECQRLNVLPECRRLNIMPEA